MAQLQNIVQLYIYFFGSVYTHDRRVYKSLSSYSHDRRVFTLISYSHDRLVFTLIYLLFARLLCIYYRFFNGRFSCFIGKDCFIPCKVGHVVTVILHGKIQVDLNDETPFSHTGRESIKTNIVELPNFRLSYDHNE